jgi:multidrug efflux system membrane fusion protein
VLVVNASGQVSYREVSVAAQHGNLRVIAAGLQPGERLVVNGTQRVRPGDSVRAHMVPMTGDTDPGNPNAAPLAQRAAKQANS